MTRTPWLPFGLALLLLALPLAGPAGAQGQERRITLDFRDAPLGDVLRSLFRDTGYSFTLDSDFEDCRVTITLREVSFSQALRAILTLADLTYAKSGSVYQIPPGAPGSAPPEPGLPPSDEGIETPDLSRPVTLHLRDVPIRTALDALLEDIPVRYVLPPGAESVRVSVDAEEEQCCGVLMAVLDQADLTCDREDGVLRIQSLQTAEAEALEFRRQAELRRAMQPIPEGKHRMLYVADYGQRDQLRVRVFPYEASDAVLWQSPDGDRISYFLPSPDWSRTLVVWQKRGTRRVAIVYLSNGAFEDVPELSGVYWALWTDADTIAAFLRTPEGLVERLYDTTEMKLSAPAEPAPGRAVADDPELAFLSQPLDKAIGIIRAMLTEDTLAVPIRADEVEGSLVRGAGIPYAPPSARDLPIAHPVAAVSPDGEYIALTTGRSKDAVFVIWRHHVYGSDYSSRVWEVIPLTALVSGESVWVTDLHWSPDGQRLLFTEVHFHPARFHAPDMGGDVPDPLDWTHLIRMYSLRAGETETIIVGRQGCLMPDPEMSRPHEGDE